MFTNCLFASAKSMCVILFCVILFLFPIFFFYFQFSEWHFTCIWLWLLLCVFAEEFFATICEWAKQEKYHKKIGNNNSRVEFARANELEHEFLYWWLFFVSFLLICWCTHTTHIHSHFGQVVVVADDEKGQKDKYRMFCCYFEL